ncbi:hypothetical protein [Caenispirillum salinarum]|uniref:hypothetical protein n=1 Tax=Caenispirillum salinarum TaxID=859058 RepID=UPI00384FE27D
MADTDQLNQRLNSLEARIRKVEQAAHPVAPSDHDVASLLQDLWGEHARVRHYLAEEGEAPEPERSRLASPADADDSMNEMEKLLAQAEALHTEK